MYTEGEELEFPLLDSKLRGCYDVVMAAVKRYSWNVQARGAGLQVPASEELLNNYEILNATSDNFMVVMYLPDNLKKFKSYRGWIKGHVGNKLPLYHNDFDIKVVYE